MLVLASPFEVACQNALPDGYVIRRITEADQRWNRRVETYTVTANGRESAFSITHKALYQMGDGANMARQARIYMEKAQRALTAMEH